MERIQDLIPDGKMIRQLGSIWGWSGGEMGANPIKIKNVTSPDTFRIASPFFDQHNMAAMTTILPWGYYWD